MPNQQPIITLQLLEPRVSQVKHLFDVAISIAVLILVNRQAKAGVTRTSVI